MKRCFCASVPCSRRVGTSMLGPWPTISWGARARRNAVARSSRGTAPAKAAMPSGSGWRAASSRLQCSARKWRTWARKSLYSALYSRFTGASSRMRSADCLQLPGRSVEQRARHEADSRHRGVQEIAQHVDQDAPHGDVAAEALEQVGAVVQPLDHRVELILARGHVHLLGS